jgi:hypothetical protein
LHRAQRGVPRLVAATRLRVPQLEHEMIAIRHEGRSLAPAERCYGPPTSRISRIAV